jgi:hypothetical protein
MAIEPIVRRCGDTCQDGAGEQHHSDNTSLHHVFSTLFAFGTIGLVWQ